MQKFKRFKQVKFRCQNCQILFAIKKPEVMSCPSCKKEYDFEFLSRPPSSPQYHVKPIEFKIPEIPIDTKIEDFKSEIEELKVHDRHVKTIEAKTQLIRILKDHFKLSFSEIGRRLLRHHSTIMHHYYGWNRSRKH